MYRFKYVSFLYECSTLLNATTGFLDQLKARFLCKIADKPFQCRNGKLIFFLKRNVLLHLQLLKFTQRKLIENMFSLKGFYQTPFKNSAANFLSSKTISRCTVAIKKENNIKSQKIPLFTWKTCLNIVN